MFRKLSIIKQERTQISGRLLSICRPVDNLAAPEAFVNVFLFDEVTQTMGICLISSEMLRLRRARE